MTPGARLRELRLAAGLTPETLAERVGSAASTVRAHENEQNGIKPKAATAYATALGVSPEDILFPGQRLKAASSPGRVVEGVRRVPVLGVVQAGAWAEVMDHDPEPAEWVVFDEPEYARAKAFALIVRGPSTNRVYPDGSRIVCIPATEGGVRDGDFVVVRRTRGSFVETTLKQLSVNAAGAIELWPRSDDPAFQEPYLIEKARDADDGVEIIAVVVARYDVGRSGRGPLLDLR
jgi:transcriptional regulator with XRE-family HTH domain